MTEIIINVNEFRRTVDVGLVGRECKPASGKALNLISFPRMSDIFRHTLIIKSSTLFIAQNTLFLSHVPFKKKRHINNKKEQFFEGHTFFLVFYYAKSMPNDVSVSKYNKKKRKDWNIHTHTKNP